MRETTFRALLGIVCLGCAGQAPIPKRAVPDAPAPPRGVPAGEVVVARASSVPMPRERPELGQAFAEQRVSGTIALLDSADNILTCSDVARCTKPVLPASTFKIVNSIVALENDLVSDPETLLPWDGAEYSVAEWNQDLTLRTAMRVSCVPCFQALARKIGSERMADWLARLKYGNQDTSGGIDRFWLSGGLRVSPVEQIDFLRRLVEEELQIRPRTLEIVQEILTLDVTQEHLLRGKTGLARKPEAPALTAWFVGWVERGSRRVYFATLIDDAPVEVDVVPLRRRITERVLSELGILPAGDTEGREADR